MKIDFKHDLLTIDLLVVLLIILVFLFSSNVLRIVIGLPFVLFFPGYVLLTALYPRQGSINGLTIFALSFGLSLAVVPLIGLALNYMPWGITLQSIIYSETIYIITMSAIAWFRRHRLPEKERFRIEFTLDLSEVWGPGVINKLLSIALVVAVLGVFGTLGYVVAKPKVNEKFTEFYILGEAGKAQAYPTKLAIGEKATIIVGIANHEFQSANYTVEVKIGDTTVTKTGPVILAHDEKWEGDLTFISETTGSQKVEFYLYRDNGIEPYLEPLRLWVDVLTIR